MPGSGAHKVRGLFTALITPFSEQGALSTDRLADLVEFQLSKGTEGIFLCGSTGLGPLLSVEERKLVAETVVEGAGGRVPVVVQVGCPDTQSSVELAKHAERTGADAVASFTPYYYKHGESAISRHFETVHNAVSIPLLAYNIPQFTGNNLSAKLVADLARGGVITGIKDSSRDLLHVLDLLEAVPEGFAVMNGTEEYGLYAIMSGADGLVSGGASALPEVFKPMVSAQRDGDFRRASGAQRLISRVKGLVRQSPVPAYYAVLRARGIDCGAPRPPFLPMGREDAARVVTALKDLGVL